MKITRMIAATLTILFLLIGSFVSGFVLPDAVNAQSPKEFVASLQLLPERFEQLSRPATDDTAHQLPLIDTYQTVLAEISNKYYGKKVDQLELTYYAVRGMLEALNDPYTRFLDPKEAKDMKEQNEGDFVGIGAHLETNPKTQQVFILEPIEDSPAFEAGLRKGDVITKVDNKPIMGIELTEVVKRIRGERNTTVKLTIQRPKVEKPLEFNIVRRMVEYKIVRTRMLDEENKIGYIKLLGFNEKSDGQFDKGLTKLEEAGIKALVLDLRDNPGGLLTTAVDIGSRFIEDGPIVVIRERGGRESSLNVEKVKHNHNRYPLVVLINGRSASASEIVAGAIRDTNAGTLVGTTTFGKGKVQTIVPLTDGSALSITTAQYLTPKRVDINKVGITPDIEVADPDIMSVLVDDEDDPFANDGQVLKAKEILLQKLNVASAAVKPREVGAKPDASAN